ncbi:YHS domain-containing protein (plasmid) [Burkholderia thailandensis]|uniref:YHS domain-containing protein n=1 Tax=Burkholderia thailandensis TaxID=57975 RepID=UPI00192DE986|nr:YHS domain-containing protein [Burkholderia thailandensis]MBS2132123.1 YHS domain-containing protein [Burkholderia thailandensis]QRA15231.1 YHS domain-containing protein [Burkholderia thailandensis]
MKTTDPVCGMQIDTEKAAATEVVHEQTYHFCSASCHEKFLANPDQYVKPQGSSAEHARHHGC